MKFNMPFQEDLEHFGHIEMDTFKALEAVEKGHTFAPCDPLSLVTAEVAHAHQKEWESQGTYLALGGLAAAVLLSLTALPFSGWFTFAMLILFGGELGYCTRKLRTIWAVRKEIKALAVKGETSFILDDPVATAAYGVLALPIFTSDTTFSDDIPQSIFSVIDVRSRYTHPEMSSVEGAARSSQALREMFDRIDANN